VPTKPAENAASATEGHSAGASRFEQRLVQSFLSAQQTLLSLQALVKPAIYQDGLTRHIRSAFAGQPHDGVRQFTWFAKPF